MGGYMNRQRQHQETDQTYNPDLEYAQAGVADQMYGRGAPTGSWGMNGGQYPTVGKDRTGFGSDQYGNPWDYRDRPDTLHSRSDTGAANANYNRQGGGPRGIGGADFFGQPSGGPPGGGAGPAGGPRGGNQIDAGSRPQGYGDYSQMGGGASQGGFQWGQGDYGNPANGGSQQPGQGYQWGSGGAAANRDAAGGAEFGSLNSLNHAYGRLGRQGVTQGERQNLMAASNEAVQSNLSSAHDQVANRAAQSGNAAGVAGAQARLGQSSGQQLEAAARSNQTAIMQENQRRKEAGLAGQAGVAQGYGQMANTETGYMGNLLGERGKLGSLSRRNRTEGTGTGGGGSISASSFGGFG